MAVFYTNRCHTPGISEKKDIEIQVFTKDEIIILRKSLETHRLKCLILMALGTGLRQGELLALNWNDIDMAAMEINVVKSIKRVKLIEADGSSRHEIIMQTPKTKTSKRIVPIPSLLIPMLKKHMALQKLEKLKSGKSYTDNKLIFATATGNPLCTKNLFNSYKCLLIKAGIEHKKFHALRHTYATKLFEKGVPLKTVSILLGHSDIFIAANIYTHVMPKEKTTAVENLNELFE